MKIYWVSWYQPTEDHRPLTSPPNKSILGWWKTREDNNGRSIICSLVRSKNPAGARKAVKIDWPEAEDWRFNSENKNNEMGDRFPIEEKGVLHIPIRERGWMKERLDANQITQ